MRPYSCQPTAARTLPITAHRKLRTSPPLCVQPRFGPAPRDLKKRARFPSLLSTREPNRRTPPNLVGWAAMWEKLQARPLWIICVLGTVLMLALVVADRARPGGRAIVKLSGVDPLSYFAVSHSLLFDRDLDLGNQYETLIAARG